MKARYLKLVMMKLAMVAPSAIMIEVVNCGLLWVSAKLNLASLVTISGNFLAAGTPLLKETL